MVSDPAIREIFKAKYTMHKKRCHWSILEYEMLISSLLKHGLDYKALAYDLRGYKSLIKIRSMMHKIKKEIKTGTYVGEPRIVDIVE